MRSNGKRCTLILPGNTEKMKNIIVEQQNNSIKFYGILQTHTHTHIPFNPQQQTKRGESIVEINLLMIYNNNSILQIEFNV